MSYFAFTDVPSEVYEDMARERRRLARLRHWCSECRGFTGPGSPCEPEPEDNATEDDDE